MNKTELKIVLSTEPTRTTTGVIHSHIPVPRVTNAIKALERCPPARRGSFEKLSRGVSVAAQKASFEKLDASVQLRPKNNNLSASSIEMRNTEEKLTSPVFANWRTNETTGGVGVAKLNRSNSLESKWKNKYEESEKRRKLLLQKSEAANKDHVDLERKYQHLQKQNSALQSQVQENEQKLQKMRTVSEAVCKEYEQLKHQYDVETGAMHKAMQQASQWYRQNRELKRRSQIITQKFLQNNHDGSLDIDVSDEVDSNFEDLDQLRETVKGKFVILFLFHRAAIKINRENVRFSELSKEIARLQTELHSARLQEFEAQEQVTHLTTQLEEEKSLRQKCEEKVNEMKVHKENMERVTKMVAEEVQSLKTQCDRERENAKIMKIEAERVQKERNVLAHQSALLMAEVGDDPNGRLLTVLQEVESLKRLLEEEQQSHASHIQMLEEKLEEKESNVEFEIVEEKLKLAESELEVAMQRAERAEKSMESLENVIQSLKAKIGELEEKLSRPPPPPLPPPPPPPMFNNGGQSSMKLLTKEKMNSERNAVTDMENMLGIAKKTPTVAQQPAIDDIINQIKGGRFTLKQTDKQREEERRRRQEAESAPPAVSEMLNILGTMRRRAKPVKQSFQST
ncbi:shootin-1 isoform X1 [Hylaeus volcanicus]|uniref:shootin-1 isoform X1 n=1 Tax=Hylaeus volcanicus TaxID=313075 RepID=UPI0023B814C0|nr:shootin-1 isoform X1 [Hylaeus volcanicus]XP_053979834.1 shootin-1 isoform X1 [Hylaeus volcanicus]XP_053979841.1 shootin-1 isoform X1 [Hylaeus volcanicus]XP_053979850.1 shootin-1 isoform X1 [Hylaeus volcanicus]